MFDFLKRRQRHRAQSGGGEVTEAIKSTEPAAAAGPLSGSLQHNKTGLTALFCDDNDFIVREFELPLSDGIPAALFFLDGLVSGDAINDAILRPLMLESRRLQPHSMPEINSVGDLCAALLPTAEIKITGELEQVVAGCLMGDSVLMVEGMAQAVVINTKGFERRSVQEPQTEMVVRGPREGFTEVLRVNTSLIRRRLKTPHLRLKMMEIGEKTATAVCLAWLDNVANPALVKEVERRLRTIDTDAILNSGYIEEYIEDAPLSVFQTIGYSEKPDIVVAKLLEGRCALIIDGTPFVLTMPMLFVESFQSPEDYAVRPYIAMFLRVIRVIAFFISLTAPALYVAMTLFHQELIPTTLLFTIAASSEGIPFNSVVETSLMLLTFEILKEAGIRLPKPVGQAISIVGALVMGQTAIEAGIAGAPVVIVIAFTAVAGFLVPNLSDAVTILRWYLLVLSALLGGYGITLGLMTILIHLAAIESFGAVYLYPFSPLNVGDMKDGILRAPLWSLRTRPGVLRPLDRVRQRMQKPHFGQDDTQ